MKISIWFQNKPRSFIGLSMSDKKLLKNCNRALCTLCPDTSFIRGYFYLLIVRYVFNKGNPRRMIKWPILSFLKAMYVLQNWSNRGSDRLKWEIT